jgi:hypothetical protein
MNTISKIHKCFSEYLNNPRVLTNPEEFLGENFEAVLNFWIILDELSEEQWRVVKKRYRSFYNENYSEWCKARDLAIDTSTEVICWYYADLAAAYAARELIAMHKILEGHQKPLTFFPMFLEVL